MELTRPGDTILLLAGKGHNGDDVRAVANHLSEREVSLLSVTDPAKTRQKLPLDLDPAPALVVDGLFGIGLNRPLNADWMQVIAQVNAKRLRVLSVDVPSGVDAATGEMQGAAIRATETLTLGAAKRGLLQPSASEFVGQLRVARTSAWRRAAKRATCCLARRRILRASRRPGRPADTRARLATWASWPAAWATTARRCSRLAARRGRSRDWSRC